MKNTSFIIILNKYIPYLLFLCICTGLTAQTSKIDSLEQVLVSAKLSNLEKADLLITISREYRWLDDTASCRKYAMEALMLAQKNGLKTMEGAAYVTLGTHYLLIGQYYPAHFNYKKAEKLFLVMNDKEWLYKVYHNLMLLFGMINDNVNELYYAGKVLEIAADRGNRTDEILVAQITIGTTRFNDDEKEEALAYWLEMYHTYIPQNTNYNHIIELNCGNIYLQMNRPREALPYLHRFRESYESGKLGVVISEAYIYLAEAYAMLHRVDSAEYYLKKAQESPLADDETKRNLYRNRSAVEAIKGNYQTAFENYMKYHYMSDSITKEGTADISLLSNWFELEQKNAINQILQHEKHKQHCMIMILTGSLVMIFILLALSVFFYRITTGKNRELKQLHTVKDKLFSVVAHDLRNPMGALTSILKLANNGMIDAETQARLLNEISTRVEDTYGLLDNLLHWSKSQMQGMVPSSAYFNVQEESRSVTDSLQNMAKSKMITLNNSIQNHQAYADRDMFAVVVRNLTTNALKYTSSGGEVTLASELSDGMLIISVKDSGTGMTQKVQNKLFQLPDTKSQRGTNNESGTGLGLVLCADFVKINGGSIWFNSEIGKGSTFYFSIPVKRVERK